MKVGVAILPAPVEQADPYLITHYLQHDPFDWRRALCGAKNPVLDLRPVNGEITCVVCLDLWAAGYLGPGK